MSRPAPTPTPIEDDDDPEAWRRSEMQRLIRESDEEVDNPKFDRNRYVFD